MKMRKFLSILLVLALCASLLPMAVLAADDDGNPDDSGNNCYLGDKCPGGGCDHVPLEEPSAGTVAPILSPTQRLLLTHTPLGSGYTEDGGKYTAYALDGGGSQVDSWDRDDNRSTFLFDPSGGLVGASYFTPNFKANFTYQRGALASGDLWDEENRAALGYTVDENGIFTLTHKSLDGAKAPTVAAGFDPNTWHAGEEPVYIWSGSYGEVISYRYGNGDQKMITYGADGSYIVICENKDGKVLFQAEYNADGTLKELLIDNLSTPLIEAAKASGATNITIGATAATSTGRGQGTSTTVENEDGSTTTTTTYDDGTITTTTVGGSASDDPDTYTITTTTYPDGAYTKHSHYAGGGSDIEAWEAYDADGTGTTLTTSVNTDTTRTVDYTVKESGETVTELNISIGMLPSHFSGGEDGTRRGSFKFSKTNSQTFEAGKQYSFTVSGGKLYINDVEQTAIPEELLAAFPADVLNLIALYNPAAAPALTINPGAADSDPVTAPGTVAADQTTVTLPSSTVGDIAAQTGASLTVSTPVADVAIPSGGLAELAGQGNVTVSTQKDGNTVELNLTAGGKSVSQVPGGITLTVPAESAGTVATLVKEDGTRQLLPSVPQGSQIHIPLEGSAKVELQDNSRSFSDVPTSHSWSDPGVQWAAANGIIAGGAAAFAPDSPLTSKQYSQMLENALGYFPASGTADVQMNDDRISRQDLAAMLWRYAGSPGATEGGSAWQQNKTAWDWYNGILDLSRAAISDKGQPITLGEACAALQAAAADTICRNAGIDGSLYSLRGYQPLGEDRNLIADAPIRDVDIAGEMMAFTKNNILIQSAQAMLAQANQLPQGVLQLLQ